MSRFLEKRTSPGHLLSFIALFQAIVEYVKRDPDEEHSEGVCVCNKGCMRKRKHSENIQIKSILWSLCIYCLPYIHKGYFQNSVLVLPRISSFLGLSIFIITEQSSFDGWDGKPVQGGQSCGPEARLPPLRLLVLGFSIVFWAASQKDFLLWVRVLIIWGAYVSPVYHRSSDFFTETWPLASMNVLKHLFIVVVHYNWETDLVS